MAGKKKTEAVGEIKVTLTRSTIGCIDSVKETVAALGLKKIRQYKIHKDIPSIQGMIKKVAHLVTVEKV